MSIITKAKKFLRMTSNVKQQTGVKTYGNLVSVQEIIREVGILLDKFYGLAPKINTFVIDTPRHAHTILIRERNQHIADPIPEFPKIKKGKIKGTYEIE